MVQRLATEMYARGLSTRDIEDAFTDEQGRCLLSRSKVSEVTEVLWEQYEAFQNRDLSDLPLLCLFLDGLYEPLRTHGITREAILCAWGITLDGRKVLISLSLGNKESGEAWLEFFVTSIVVACPHLCSSPPTVPADSFRPSILCGPRACLAAGCTGCGTSPKSRWHEIKPYLLMIRDAPDLEAGQKAVREFLAKFRKSPGPVQMPHRGPGRASGPTPAPLAAQEVHPHHQSDRTQLRRGETQDQNTAPFLHREELPQTRLRCPDPSCGKVASHQHHLHRISSAQNAYQEPNSLSHRTGRRSSSARRYVHGGILQDSQDLRAHWAQRRVRLVVRQVP